jgi:hypothetical protein
MAGTATSGEATTDEKKRMAKEEVTDGLAQLTESTFTR